MSWYFRVLKKYAVFAGRARRKEYWIYNLINLLILVVLDIADPAKQSPTTSLGPLAAVYVLATFLPSLGVLVRRLHDTGRSGVWVLLGLVPIIGSLIVLVFTIQDSEPGQNQYGANPKMPNPITSAGSVTPAEYSSQTMRSMAAAMPASPPSTQQVVAYCAHCGMPLAAANTACATCGNPT